MASRTGSKLDDSRVCIATLLRAEQLDILRCAQCAGILWLEETKRLAYVFSGFSRPPSGTPRMAEVRIRH
ncbi:MAG: hypothetical protein QOI97_5324 [Pseudomonas sp.]|jgi:hypothetical protein|nr:hypothetical protein [Pseudomonas sp.]